MSESPTTTTPLKNKIEEWHNKASDLDVIWFPFTFLKPKPAQLIDIKRLLVMAPLFGLYFNAGNQLRRYLFSKPVLLENVLWDQLYWTIGFFVWFNLVTARLWNIRARRLSK